MTMNADDFSLDELASAYLDNEVTPTERARAEFDPAVMARVAQFRSLDAQVSADFATDLPAVAATQDHMVARALGLFERRVDIDPEVDSPAVTQPPAVVVPLARHQRRTIPWTTLAVAAAVLGGLVIVGRSISLSGSDESSESARANQATAATAAAAAPAPAAVDAASVEAAIAPAEPVATEAAAPAMTDAASAQPATVVTIGTIDGGATAGDTQSTESAPTAAESTGEFANTTVVSLTVEDQLQVYVASLAGNVADRKVALVSTNCQISGVAVENVSWQGVAGVLVLSPDATTPTTAEIIDSTCAVLVSVTITR